MLMLMFSFCTKRNSISMLKLKFEGLLRGRLKSTFVQSCPLSRTRADKRLLFFLTQYQQSQNVEISQGVAPTHPIPPHTPSGSLTPNPGPLFPPPLQLGVQCRIILLISRRVGTREADARPLHSYAPRHI